MNATFSWFEAAILAGIAQGCLISCLIWARRNSGLRKKILSLVLIVFSFLCVRILILTTGLWEQPLLRYFPLPFELAIGPLFWLYAVSLVEPRFSLKRSALLHFIPFGISLLYSVTVYCLVLPEGNNPEKDNLANSFWFNEIKNIEDYLCIVSAIIYWSLGLRLVLRYRRWLADNISDTDFPTYAWLKNIVLLLGVVVVFFTADILLDSIFKVGLQGFTHWKFFFLYCAALIYYLGFRGYQLQDSKALVKQELYNTPFTGHDPEKGDLIPGSLPQTESKLLPVSGKQVKLTDEKAAGTGKAITEAMEIHRLYLDPELNLVKLAKFVSSTPAAVSYAINRQFGKSFRSLVNEYRVASVKKQLADRRSDQFSILGIAYDCGFNSEASFYRIFKSVAGMSPTEYLKSMDRSG
jgi:AraC-like DNA-binding protein